MSLSHPIQLRLQPEKQYFYQEEAARQGKPLASYLRERLDNNDEKLEAINNLKREVMSLRLMVEDIIATSQNTPSNNDNANPTLFEMLLLLRQLSRPEHLKIAQGELQRLGFKVRQW